VKTALASKDRANMRQGLRIVDHLGLKQLLSKTTEAGAHSRRTVKSQFFYASKLAGGVLDTVEYVLRADSGRRRSSEEEVNRWQALASISRKATEDTTYATYGQSFLPIP